MDGMEEKLQALRQFLQEMKRVMVAFSAGVDSTFLLGVAVQELGTQVLAVTARSPSYPTTELEEAVRLARHLGARHRVIDSEEMAIPGYRQNSPRRCYFCKGELYSKLQQMAAAEGNLQIVDGSNADDQIALRPGMQAAAELGVRSPLREVGLTKEEIRTLSRHLQLPTWDKPAMACLSSRIPYGEPVSVDKLTMVERAEALLRALGFGQLRVRHHGPIARIEVPAADLPRFLEDGLATTVIHGLKEVGFTFVTLDLEGYRSGSMHEGMGQH